MSTPISQFILPPHRFVFYICDSILDTLLLGDICDQRKWSWIIAKLPLAGGYSVMHLAGLPA